MLTYIDIIGYDVNAVQPLASDGTFHLLTVNYYDDYNFPGAMSTLPPFTIPELSDQGDVTEKTKGLPTGSWIRVLTTTSEKLFEFTHIFYDQKARPIRTHHKNHLGGYTQTDTYLDFIGNPQYTITTHKRTNSDTELTVREEFEYTPEGRLLEHRHKVNTFPIETLSYNNYDELGQLKTKNVGSSPSTPLQTVDYKYNIRGWLTDINDVKTLGNDLFAFKIGYDTGLTSGGLYNGNISETSWRSSTDNSLRGYLYDYDDLNRLNRADYRRYGISLVDGSINIIHTNSYNENNITYDKNGNILSMFRTGDLDSADYTIPIDDLRYTYDDGNKLLKVIDCSNHPEGFADGADYDEEYGYDIFGNMIKDLNKQIAQITYNHLNLPKEISFSGTPTRKINYLYNATGQKVAKNITNNSTETMTDYLNGFHYENQRLMFSATSEGYVNIRATSKNAVTNVNYVYNYTDHLGNIRVSYAFRSTTGQAEIMEENHYYPFGLKHKKYGSVDKDIVCIDEDCYEVGIDVVPPQTRKPYQYKYNGKEFQDELGLNLYDFGFRNYAPDLGRWMNIDPLAEKRYYLTPYNYVQNSPLFRFDPNGLTDFTLDKKTGEVKQVGDTNDEPDRILKTNSKGNVKIKGEGFLGFLVKKSERGKKKVAIDGVKKGILEDGQNYKDKGVVVNIGEDNKLSKEDVESFVMKLSNYINKEIGGTYVSVDNSGNITHMSIGRYKDNEIDKIRGDGLGVIILGNEIKNISQNLNFILGHYHTHPKGTRSPSPGDEQERDDWKKKYKSSIFYIFINSNKPTGYEKIPY